MQTTFSNGFTDTYKGNRPVKFAWCIIRKSDNVTLASGHSLDYGKAQKTADSHIFPSVATIGRAYQGVCDKPRACVNSAYFGKLARERGFDSWKSAYAAFQADMALARAAVKIEIVQL